MVGMNILETTFNIICPKTEKQRGTVWCENGRFLAVFCGTKLGQYLGQFSRNILKHNDIFELSQTVPRCPSSSSVPKHCPTGVSITP